MHAAQSSVKKGETLIDTAMTLNAMRADVIVIRHGSSGAVRLIADKVDCPVLNAGDGRHEHPTQALLDALTIRRRTRQRSHGQRVAICGDVLHSRVARSNILCADRARRRGARLRAADADAGRDRARWASTPFTDFDAALDGADVVMMLRLQNERMDGQFVPSPARIPPPLRPDARAAGARRARCAGDASRADEPRGRDRQQRRRPCRPLGDHRAGRDGRRGPHGLPRRADPPRARRGGLGMKPRAPRNRDGSAGPVAGGVHAAACACVDGAHRRDRRRRHARRREMIDCRAASCSRPGIVDLGVFAIDKPAFRFGGITRVGADARPVAAARRSRRASSVAAQSGKPDLWVHPLAAATRGLEGERARRDGADARRRRARGRHRARAGSPIRA